jgi:hypothetical protein
VLRDPELRARLAADGREYARTWSATALAGRLEAFYRSVLGTGIAAARRYSDLRYSARSRFS